MSTSNGAVLSGTPSAVEDLFDVLATIFMRCLKIMQFLSEILHLQLQLRRFLAQPLVGFDYWTRDEPVNR
jgi:hypothetical protein